MSFTPSSGQISASQIRTAFGITGSLSLGSRRSTSFWRSNAFLGTLPASTIRMSDFYGMRGSSPVTPSTTYYSASNGTTQGATVTQAYTVPLYYQLQINCRAAGGGGGGGAGGTFNPNGTLSSLGNGSAGASGGNTSFGTIASATGGGGGGGGPLAGTPAAGAAGAGSDGIAVGGAGGGRGVPQVSDGAAGGAGGFTSTTLLSPANGGTGPAPGTVITITVGAGGAGGGGYGNGGPGGPGRYGEFAVIVS